MSDTSQGPGWWRASNGLWYPPEATPGPRPSRPPGVPDRPPADPRVQPPFTLRRVEPIETPRERRSDRRAAEARRSIPWGWIGVGLLVVAFGGFGTWLALTAGDGSTSAPPTTSAEAPPDTSAGTAAPVAPSTTESAATSSSTSAPDEELTSVFDIADGDCFSPADPDTGDDGLVVAEVEVVDCDEPHLAEVIAVLQLEGDAGAAFPGVAARDAAAQDLCLPAFEDRVGVPLASSELGLVWFAPTEASWSDEGDRVVACAVQALDGDPLIGSVVGSAR